MCKLKIYYKLSETVKTRKEHSGGLIFNKNNGTIQESIGSTSGGFPYAPTEQVPQWIKEPENPYLT